MNDLQGGLWNPASNHRWILIGAECGLRIAKRFESRINAVSGAAKRSNSLSLREGTASAKPV